MSTPGTGRRRGRPRKYPEGGTVPFGTRVPPQVKEAFREGAARQGMYLNDYVTWLVAKDLNRPDLLQNQVVLFPPTG